MLTKHLLALAIVGAFSTAALAAEMPTQRMYQSTPYLTGGIGEDEAEAMRQAASNYSLAMTFAAQTGQFVSDVDVAVKNQGGQVVLQAADAAPILLADLPAGRYQIEATYNGQKQTRQVTVGQDGTSKVVLQWQVPGLESLSERASLIPGS
jgi:hypothetical protein